MTMLGPQKHKENKERTCGQSIPLVRGVGMANKIGRIKLWLVAPVAFHWSGHHSTNGGGSGNNLYFHASKLISQAWMRTLLARGNIMINQAATTIVAVSRDRFIVHKQEFTLWT